MVKWNRGFTLIELLVVIAIIGVLSSVALVALNEARIRAQKTAAELELKQFSTALVAAQIQTGQTLVDIVTGCSDCRCYRRADEPGEPIDTRNIPETHQCYANMRNAFVKINQASGGMIENYIDNFRDPWGSPYMLDENELEWDDDPCRQDRIRSHGPDGIRGGGDDITIVMPFTTPQCIN